MSVDLEDHYYQFNGITLHTVEAGNKSGEYIVFLHGFPEFWYGWSKQLFFFAKKGFRVIVPDQRGYNLSSKPAGAASYRLQLLTADIAALIESFAGKKAVVVGHDWGGAVAWHLALNHPQLIKRLVVVNMPHPEVFRQTLKRSFAQLIRSSYAGFFQIPLLPEWASRVFNFALLRRSMRKTANQGAFTKEDMTTYQKAWQQPGALTAMINWYRAYRYNKHARTGLVQLPVLLIWGKKDRFLRYQMAAESIKKCSNGKLVMVENATHWIHHEHPLQVNTLITDFITSQPTAQ